MLIDPLLHHRSRCDLLVKLLSSVGGLILGAAVVDHAYALQDPPPNRRVVTVQLTAKVDADRLVGIDYNGLDKLNLVSGDRVEIALTPRGQFDAEYWSRRYTWTKEEKRGKKKVKTPMVVDAETTWQPRWGAGLDGVLKLGGVVTQDGKAWKGSELSALSRSPARLTAADGGGAATLTFKVSPDPDRIVERPPEVPSETEAKDWKADPPEADSPKIEALINHGENVGTLKITVTRPAAQ
jgi:hypothetical protein